MESINNLNNNQLRELRKETILEIGVLTTRLEAINDWVARITPRTKEAVILEMGDRNDVKGH